LATLFFFGTLRYRPLLGLVLGRPAEAEAARLPDHAAVWAEGEGFPLLLDRPGARAEGLLVTGLDDTDIARLRHYEGAFSYDLAPVTVETAGGPVAARVFRPVDAPWRPGADWSLQDWIARWGALTLETATEVMRLFGTESAASIAGRMGMIRSRAQSKLRNGARARPRTVSVPYTRADIAVEELRHPYQGFFAIEEYTARFRRFDGAMSEPSHRAVFRAADAVTVLPYDPLRDRVLLIEQVRFGAYAHGDPQPWLLEPVAGLIDAGETAEECARREAQEEAHVQVGALHHVASYYPSPGGVAQILISYVGIADLPDDATRYAGLDLEGEDIRGYVVSAGALLDMIASGEAANAPLIVTGQWLALNRDRLRATA